MAEEPAPKRRKNTTRGYICEFVVESNEIEGEEWRQVPDSIAPGNNSFVSNKGRVKTHFGIIMTPTPRKDGYVAVHIGCKTLLMHRVILTAFGIEPPSPAHKFGNHKDLDRSNNCLENLEWCTASENTQHSHANNSTRKSNAHKMSMPVRCKRDGNDEWIKYESLKEAARVLGIDHGSIAKSCRKGHRAGGYKFEYDEPNEPPHLEGEEWKKWGNAEISNLGRFKDSRGVVKTPSLAASGYTPVQIDGEQSLVHVLVAKLFLPPPGPGQTEVDHIDGKGNQWWNLRWATRSENVQHSHADPNRRSSAPKLSKKVRLRKVGTTEWQYFDSGAEAARVLSLEQREVSRICKKNK